MAHIEVKVPDIGDFKAVEVIEVLVKVGDTITVDQSLVTVESDKASMEIPSSHAGVITELKVKLGDQIAEGHVLLVVDATASAIATPTAVAATSTIEKPAIEPATAAITTPAIPSTLAPSSTPTSTYTGSVDVTTQVLVLGAGPGGYSAAFHAADLGLQVTLVERYATLGGVCLNVGCIPSKALLHTAAVLEEAQHMAHTGITFAPPTIDIDAVRAHKNQVISKLTTGLAGMAKGRKVNVVKGEATFIDAHHLSVVSIADDEAHTPHTQVIRFEHAIVAVGSHVTELPFIPHDPRIVNSTGALNLPFTSDTIPKKMLIIGGGIIGLEMATVYSALGVRLDVVEMGAGLMQGADRDLVKVWHKMNDPRFDRILLNTKTVAVEAKPEGIFVTFEGMLPNSNAPTEPQCYDFVLVAAGRQPNGNLIGADNAGINVDRRGFIAVDSQMRTNVPHIFAIGDVVGQPMLAHKAVHEGHVAAEVIAGHKTHFDARIIPSVAYTNPEVAWAGVTEDEAKQQGMQITKGVFPWAASGRAIANGRDEGFTKLLFDATTKRIIGGGIVGTNAGDLIGEVCLAIEMGADSIDIGKTIHPHPTLCESVGLAAEVAEGHCTDLPAQRKMK
jgi:dihydrolipoamide dehydrogenase